MYKQLLVELLFCALYLPVFSIELELDKSNFKSEKFNFRIDSVVDARLNKLAPVGYTKIGIKNETDVISLPADFGTYCRTFFSTLPARFEAGPRIIAVIKSAIR